MHAVSHLEVVHSTAHVAASVADAQQLPIPGLCVSTPGSPGYALSAEPSADVLMRSPSLPPQWEQEAAAQSAVAGEAQGADDGLSMQGWQTAGQQAPTDPAQQQQHAWQQRRPAGHEPAVPPWSCAAAGSSCLDGSAALLPHQQHQQQQPGVSQSPEQQRRSPAAARLQQHPDSPQDSLTDSQLRAAVLGQPYQRPSQLRPGHGQGDLLQQQLLEGAAVVEAQRQRLAQLQTDLQAHLPAYRQQQQQAPKHAVKQGAAAALSAGGRPSTLLTLLQRSSNWTADDQDSTSSSSCAAGLRSISLLPDYADTAGSIDTADCFEASSQQLGAAAAETATAAESRRRHELPAGVPAAGVQSAVPAQLSTAPQPQQQQFALRCSRETLSLMTFQRSGGGLSDSGVLLGSATSSSCAGGVPGDLAAAVTATAFEDDCSGEVMSAAADGQLQEGQHLERVGSTSPMPSPRMDAAAAAVAEAAAGGSHAEIGAPEAAAAGLAAAEPAGSSSVPFCQVGSSADSSVLGHSQDTASGSFAEPMLVDSRTCMPQSRLLGPRVLQLQAEAAAAAGSALPDRRIQSCPTMAMDAVAGSRASGNSSNTSSSVLDAAAGGKGAAAAGREARRTPQRSPRASPQRGRAAGGKVGWGSVTLSPQVLGQGLLVKHSCPALAFPRYSQPSPATQDDTQHPAGEVPDTAADSTTATATHTGASGASDTATAAVDQSVPAASAAAAAGPLVLPCTPITAPVEPDTDQTPARNLDVLRCVLFGQGLGGDDGQDDHLSTPLLAQRGKEAAGTRRSTAAAGLVVRSSGDAGSQLAAAQVQEKGVVLPDPGDCRRQELPMELPGGCQDSSMPAAAAGAAQPAMQDQYQAEAERVSARAQQEPGAATHAKLLSPIAESPELQRTTVALGSDPLTAPDTGCSSTNVSQHQPAGRQQQHAQIQPKQEQGVVPSRGAAADGDGVMRSSNGGYSQRTQLLAARVAALRTSQHSLRPQATSTLQQQHQGPAALQEDMSPARAPERVPPQHPDSRADSLQAAPVQEQQHVAAPMQLGNSQGAAARQLSSSTSGSQRARGAAAAAIMRLRSSQQSAPGGTQHQQQQQQGQKPFAAPQKVVAALTDAAAGLALAAAAAAKSGARGLQQHSLRGAGANHRQQQQQLSAQAASSPAVRSTSTGHVRSSAEAAANFGTATQQRGVNQQRRASLPGPSVASGAASAAAGDRLTSRDRRLSMPLGRGSVGAASVAQTAGKGVQGAAAGNGRDSGVRTSHVKLDLSGPRVVSDPGSMRSSRQQDSRAPPKQQAGSRPGSGSEGGGRSSYQELLRKNFGGPPPGKGSNSRANSQPQQQQQQGSRPSSGSSSRPKSAEEEVDPSILLPAVRSAPVVSSLSLTELLGDIPGASLAGPAAGRGGLAGAAGAGSSSGGHMGRGSTLRASLPVGAMYGDGSAWGSGAVRWSQKWGGGAPPRGCASAAASPLKQGAARLQAQQQQQNPQRLSYEALLQLQQRQQVPSQQQRQQQAHPQQQQQQQQVQHIEQGEPGTVGTVAIQQQQQRAAAQAGGCASPTAQTRVFLPAALQPQLLTPGTVTHINASRQASRSERPAAGSAAAAAAAAPAAGVDSGALSGLSPVQQRTPVCPETPPELGMSSPMTGGKLLGGGPLNWDLHLSRFRFPADPNTPSGVHQQSPQASPLQMPQQQREGFGSPQADPHSHKGLHVPHSMAAAAATAQGLVQRVMHYGSAVKRELQTHRQSSGSSPLKAQLGRSAGGAPASTHTAGSSHAQDGGGPGVMQSAGAGAAVAAAGSPQVSTLSELSEVSSIMQHSPHLGGHSVGGGGAFGCNSPSSSLPKGFAAAKTITNALAGFGAAAARTITNALAMAESEASPQSGHGTPSVRGLTPIATAAAAAAAAAAGAADTPASGMDRAAAAAATASPVAPVATAESSRGSRKRWDLGGQAVPSAAAAAPGAAEAAGRQEPRWTASLAPSPQPPPAVPAAAVAVFDGCSSPERPLLPGPGKQPRTLDCALVASPAPVCSPGAKGAAVAASYRLQGVQRSSAFGENAEAVGSSTAAGAGREGGDEGGAMGSRVRSSDSGETLVVGVVKHMGEQQQPLSYTQRYHCEAHCIAEVQLMPEQPAASESQSFTAGSAVSSAAAAVVEEQATSRAPAAAIGAYTATPQSKTPVPVAAAAAAGGRDPAVSLRSSIGSNAVLPAAGSSSSPGSSTQNKLGAAELGTQRPAQQKSRLRHDSTAAAATAATTAPDLPHAGTQGAGTPLRPAAAQQVVMQQQQPAGEEVVLPGGVESGVLSDDDSCCAASLDPTASSQRGTVWPHRRRCSTDAAGGSGSNDSRASNSSNGSVSDTLLHAAPAAAAGGAAGAPVVAADAVEGLPLPLGGATPVPLAYSFYHSIPGGADAANAAADAAAGALPSRRGGRYGSRGSAATAAAAAAAAAGGAARVAPPPGQQQQSWPASNSSSCSAGGNKGGSDSSECPLHHMAGEASDAESAASATPPPAGPEGNGLMGEMGDEVVDGVEGGGEQRGTSGNGCHPIGTPCVASSTAAASAADGVALALPAREPAAAAVAAGDGDGGDSGNVGSSCGSAGSATAAAVPGLLGCELSFNDLGDGGGVRTWGGLHCSKDQSSPGKAPGSSLREHQRRSVSTPRKSLAAAATSPTAAASSSKGSAAQQRRRGGKGDSCTYSPRSSTGSPPWSSQGVHNAQKHAGAQQEGQADTPAGPHGSSYTEQEGRPALLPAASPSPGMFCQQQQQQWRQPPPPLMPPSSPMHLIPVSFSPLHAARSSAGRGAACGVLATTPNSCIAAIGGAGVLPGSAAAAAGSASAGCRGGSGGGGVVSRNLGFTAAGSSSAGSPGVFDSTARGVHGSAAAGTPDGAGSCVDAEGAMSTSSSSQAGRRSNRASQPGAAAASAPPAVPGMSVSGLSGRDYSFSNFSPLHSRLPQSIGSRRGSSKTQPRTQQQQGGSATRSGHQGLHSSEPGCAGDDDADDVVPVPDSPICKNLIGDMLAAAGEEGPLHHAAAAAAGHRLAGVRSPQPLDQSGGLGGEGTFSVDDGGGGVVGEPSGDLGDTQGVRDSRSRTPPAHMQQAGAAASSPLAAVAAAAAGTALGVDPSLEQQDEAAGGVTAAAAGADGGGGGCSSWQLGEVSQSSLSGVAAAVAAACAAGGPIGGLTGQEAAAAAVGSGAESGSSSETADSDWLPVALRHQQQQDEEQEQPWPLLQEESSSCIRQHSHHGSDADGRFGSSAGYGHTQQATASDYPQSKGSGYPGNAVGSGGGLEMGRGVGVTSPADSQQQQLQDGQLRREGSSLAASTGSFQLMGESGAAAIAAMRAAAATPAPIPCGGSAAWSPDTGTSPDIAATAAAAAGSRSSPGVRSPVHSYRIAQQQQHAHQRGQQGAGSSSSTPERARPCQLAVLSLDGAIPDVRTASPEQQQQHRRTWTSSPGQAAAAVACTADSIIAGTVLSPGAGARLCQQQQQQAGPQSSSPIPRWQAAPTAAVPHPAAGGGGTSPGMTAGPLSTGLLLRSGSTPPEPTTAAASGAGASLASVGSSCSTGEAAAPKQQQQQQQALSSPSHAGAAGSARPPYLQMLEGGGATNSYQAASQLASPLSTNRHKLQHLQAQQQLQGLGIISGVQTAAAAAGESRARTCSSGAEEGSRHSLGGSSSSRASPSRALSASPSAQQQQHPPPTAVASAPTVAMTAATTPAAAAGASPGGRVVCSGGSGGAARMGRLRHRRARSDMPEYYPLSPLESPLHTAMPEDDGLDGYGGSSYSCYGGSSNTGYTYLGGVASAGVLPLGPEGSVAADVRAGVGPHSPAAAGTAEGYGITGVPSSGSLVHLAGAAGPLCPAQHSKGQLEPEATPLGSPLRTGLTSPAAQYRIQQQQQQHTLRGVHSPGGGVLQREVSGSERPPAQQQQQGARREAAGGVGGATMQQQQQQAAAVVPRLPLELLLQQQQQQQRSSIAEAVAAAVSVYDGGMSPRRLAKIQEFVASLVAVGGCDSGRRGHHSNQHHQQHQQQQGMQGGQDLIQQQQGAVGGDGGVYVDAAELTFRDAAFLGISKAGLDVSCLQQLLRLQTGIDSSTDTSQQQQQQQGDASLGGDYDSQPGSAEADAEVGDGGQQEWVVESSLVPARGPPPPAAAAAAAGDIHSFDSSSMIQEEPSECSTVRLNQQHQQQRQDGVRCGDAGGRSSSWQRGSLQRCSQGSEQLAVMQSHGALKAPAAAAMQLLTAAELQQQQQEAGGQPGSRDGAVPSAQQQAQWLLPSDALPSAGIDECCSEQQLWSAHQQQQQQLSSTQQQHQQRQVWSTQQQQQQQQQRAAEGRQQGGGGGGGNGIPETLKLLAGLAAVGLSALGSVDSTAASGATGGCVTGGEAGDSGLSQLGGGGSSRRGWQLAQQLAASVDQVISSLEIDGPKASGVGLVGVHVCSGVRKRICMGYLLALACCA